MTKFVSSTSLVPPVSAQVPQIPTFDSPINNNTQFNSTTPITIDSHEHHSLNHPLEVEDIQWEN